MLTPLAVPQQLRDFTPEIPMSPRAGPSCLPNTPNLYRGPVYSSTVSHINRLETRLESLESKVDSVQTGMFRVQTILEEILVNQARIMSVLEAQACVAVEGEDDSDDEDSSSSSEESSSDVVGKGKARAD